MSAVRQRQIPRGGGKSELVRSLVLALVSCGGDYPQTRLLSFAGENGIAALDLRRWLKAGDYLDYDLHWNANGHRVAAAVLGEYLRR